MSSGFAPASIDRPTADSSPLALAVAPPAPPRPSIPWLASAVPVVGALGFWAFTGSVFALWFALLGPMIAAAGIVDGARSARRAARAAAEDAAVARARVEAEVDERHRAERTDLRARHPDVAGYLARPEQIWRAVPDRATTIVAGAGEVRSAVRISGGGDDDVALTRRAQTVCDAPVVVAPRKGIAVVGPRRAADGVVRALALQLALARPPGALAVTGGTEAWMRALPHASTPAPIALGVGRAGEAAVEADLVVVSAEHGEALPPRCDTVLFLLDAARARLETGGDVTTLSVEAVSARQAELVAAELAARAASLDAETPDAETVTLASLGIVGPAESRVGLPVALGLTGAHTVEIDLVADGPHAVVTGMTGAGKSELLISWIVALCTAYDTSAVSFLLADFKGGTAFDALAGLPHVTGVITDLDPTAARRAIESLRAELRHREAELARSGARDIAQTDLPRLVIVIDEFAALRETHPELEALFTDVAARGRALGMHLVIGTQRASGVVRDGLLANCPLRISLRVADAHDSRSVVGTSDAAELPGGARGRGLAVVRRAGDAQPSRVRIALTSPADVARARDAAGGPARRPWLPALPASIDLRRLGGRDGVVLLGLVDDPARQRQHALELTDRALLIVGGAGSGKSTALQTIASQLAPSALLRVGPDAEDVWDALGAGVPPAPGTAVIVDDLDALAARLPGEYGRVAAEELERWIRGAGDLGLRVFASAQRLVGPAGRLADLFPRRLVLGTPSRAEHVAAGGDGADYLPDLPAGRGTIDRLAMQVAVADRTPSTSSSASSVPRWEPPQGVSGFVVRHAPPGVIERWERTGVRVREADGPGDVAAPEPGGRVVVVGDPDTWMRHPRLLELVRNVHTLVVDVSCAAEYRLLTGDRELAPFAHAGRGRAWECRAGRRARRVALAGALDDRRNA